MAIWVKVRWILIASLAIGSCNRRRAVVTDDTVSPDKPIPPTTTPQVPPPPGAPTRPLDDRPPTLPSSTPQTPTGNNGSQLTATITEYPPEKKKMLFKNCLKIKVDQTEAVLIGCNKDFSRHGQPVILKNGVKATDAVILSLIVESHRFGTAAAATESKNKCVEELQKNFEYPCNYDVVEVMSDAGENKQPKRFCLEATGAEQITVFFEDSFLEHTNPAFAPDFRDMVIKIDGKAKLTFSTEIPVKEPGHCGKS